jgi:hypothetical protein
MGRGLDGYFFVVPVVGGLCSFEGPRGVRAGSIFVSSRVGLEQFPVAIARGKHLFPFRTEQLSPAAPMVLGTHVPGRVGRRRSFLTSRPQGGSSSFGVHPAALLGQVSGVARSIAGQPASRSRSARSAAAPPRRPNSRLASSR